MKEDEQFKESVISSKLLEDALDWISSNMEPEDVFDEKALEEWAEKNDYSKEE
jgi:hypothetical protein